MSNLMSTGFRSDRFDADQARTAKPRGAGESSGYDRLDYDYDYDYDYDNDNDQDQDQDNGAKERR